MQIQADKETSPPTRPTRMSPPLKILAILFASFILFVAAAVLASIRNTRLTLIQGQTFCDGVVLGSPIDSAYSEARKQGAESVIVLNPERHAVQSGTKRSPNQDEPLPEVQIQEGTLWVSFRGSFTFFNSACSIPFQNKLVTGKKWAGAG